MIFNIIKPDKTADFEAVMAKVKEALAKSDKPKRKQMALSWRVFKGARGRPRRQRRLRLLVRSAGQGRGLFDHRRSSSEAFPNEAQDLWSKFVNCFATGQTMLNLSQVVNMSPNATATVPK